jgi:DNA-binding transcriptional ArsR family regulator
MPPFDDSFAPIAPRVEPSAAVELSWLVISCSAPNRELVSDELKGRADTFWKDGFGLQPEVLLLAQQLGCQTGWDIEPLFSMEHRPLPQLRSVDMRTETPEQQLAIAERMERLRREKALRRRYSALLSDTWAHCLDHWNELGRPTVERALLRMRSSLEHGLAPIELIPDSHIARREAWVGLTREALGQGTALISPCYFAGARGHIVAMPGVLSLAIGTGVSQDMARRRTEVEQIARGLKLLGDPTRLLILTELEREPAGVGDIARRVSVAQPTASVHIKQLREAGFISATKEAGGNVYRVRQERLRQVLDAAREATRTGSN